MKCDELKEIMLVNQVSGERTPSGTYKKAEVDAAIAELKQKLQDQCISCPVKMQEADVVAELKKDLEDAKATAYAESVDAGMRERRLKRALYKACANWALSTLAWLDCIDQGEPRKWSEMVRKCRNKVEEYK